MFEIGLPRKENVVALPLELPDYWNIFNCNNFCLYVPQFLDLRILNECDKFFGVYNGVISYLFMPCRDF